MILTHKLNLQHLNKDQMGALVAHVVNMENFFSIKVNVSLDRQVEAEISFELMNEISAYLKDLTRLEDEIQALANLDPMPCACGCGAFIAISPCHKQSGNLMIGQLTPMEFEEAKRGNKIGAIKMVRERTKLGLHEAKDLINQSGAYDYPKKFLTP